MPFSHEVLVANGTTSFGRIVLSKAILDLITNSSIIGLAVNVGGSGYVVGETFDIVGGTVLSGFVARGIVTSEAAGVVTGVKYISAGAYSALPGVTGAATTNSSAAGDDALTVDLTTLAPQWTLDRSDYADAITDFEWICTSIKASNPATIGLITEASAGNDAIKVLTSSGYDSGALFSAQPDGSPEDVTYLNVPGTNPELYVSTTERVVNFVSRDGNNVQYGGAGLFLPLTNVDASYPFPGVAHAQSRSVRAMTEQYNDIGTGAVNTGIVHPGKYQTVFPPYYYRDNLSTQWLGIAQVSSASGARSMVWPNKQDKNGYLFTLAPQVSSKSTDPFGTAFRGIFSDALSAAGGWFENAATVQAIGVPGVAPFGTGLQMSFTVAAHIISSQTGNVQVIGYVDGFVAVHGVGLTAFEEIESYLSASRYIVFPDTNGSNIGRWVAMEIR